VCVCVDESGEPIEIAAESGLGVTELYDALKPFAVRAAIAASDAPAGAAEDLSGETDADQMEVQAGRAALQAALSEIARGPVLAVPGAEGVAPRRRRGRPRKSDTTVAAAAAAADVVAEEEEEVVEAPVPVLPTIGPSHENTTRLSF
jgi:hypothetical protein